MSREPSMEDILSSIRRVIARDEAQIQSRIAHVVPVSEVLGRAEAAGEKAEQAPNPNAAPNATFSADDFPASDRPIKSFPAEEFIREEGAVSADAVSADDAASETPAALVSNNAADATRQSLEALNAAFANAPAGSIAPQPATRTLDDVVMEALRPMLKQWLDHNLPPIVEAMVAKEIARITGRS